jgi:hypothetical protein
MQTLLSYLFDTPLLYCDYKRNNCENCQHLFLNLQVRFWKQKWRTELDSDPWFFKTFNLAQVYILEII